MRKLAIAAALVLGLVVVASAGDYHEGATLICAQCHVMHGSQTEGYNPDGSGEFTPVGGDAPYHYLLRNHINELCLECHDNSWGPDVLDVDGGTNPPTLGRLAGYLNGTVNGTAYGQEHTGHTLGSTEMAPGGTFQDLDEGLVCTDCHSQHGRTFNVGGGVTTSQYRNLWPTQITYAIGTNVLTEDVFERSASFGGNHYDLSNVDFNEPDIVGSAYGEFCQNCHTDFHGNASDDNMRVLTGAAGEEWLRHPTAEANIGGVGGGHSRLSVWEALAYRVKVMSPTGNWGTQGTPFGAGLSPTDLTPSCFTCHRGHGNANAFGLVYPSTDGSLPINENGPGNQAKQLCKECHAQG